MELMWISKINHLSMVKVYNSLLSLEETKKVLNKYQAIYWGKELEDVAQYVCSMIYWSNHYWETLELMKFNAFKKQENKEVYPLNIIIAFFKKIMEEQAIYDRKIYKTVLFFLEDIIILWWK